MKISKLLVAAVTLLPLLANAQTPAPTPAPTPASAPAPAAVPAPVATPAPKPVDTAPQVAARAELITGSVTIGTGAAARALSAGDEIFERQTVIVGPNSYANLRFKDGGHVLLRPNTEFAVESFRFTAAPVTVRPMAGAAPAAPASAENLAFFRLVRGGFRALSGLIGKVDHAAYKVTTPAATIGIRGTDFEVAICTNDCPQQAGGEAGGTIAATHEGSISLQTTRGEFTVNAGQVAFALLNGQTFMLPVVPDAMLQNPAPSPEGCN